MATDRRHHRRIPLRLKVTCHPAGPEGGDVLRAVTSNVSGGGLMLEVEVTEETTLPEPHSTMKVEISVPPGQGHFPYKGRVSSVAEVLRSEPIAGSPAAPGARSAPRKIGLALRFKEPLKLAF